MQQSSKEVEFEYLHNETAQFIALLLSRLQAELHLGRVVSKCVGLLFECPSLPTCPAHMSSCLYLCLFSMVGQHFKYQSALLASTALVNVVPASSLTHICVRA